MRILKGRRPMGGLARTISLAIAAAAAACGNAEVVAPEPLAIVDTYPGNGSLVAKDETTIAATFSHDVERDSLSAAIALEETGAGAVRPIALTFDRYEASTFTAVFRSEPLAPASTFALRISAGELKATSGATLRSDVVRTFRTTE
jgi:hypothetical protein